MGIYESDNLCPIGKRSCTQRDQYISTLCSHIIHDLNIIIPWRVRLDAFSHTHDLVTKCFLQASKVVCLANGA